jgi:hypothetical protein
MTEETKMDNAETREYTYRTEVRGSQGVVHQPGDTVTQYKDRHGHWRDVEVFHKRGGEKMEDSEMLDTINDVCAEATNLLARKCQEVYKKLTPEEIEIFGLVTLDAPVVAKALLLAVAADVLTEEFSDPSLHPSVVLALMRKERRVTREVGIPRVR